MHNRRSVMTWLAWLLLAPGLLLCIPSPSAASDTEDRAVLEQEVVQLRSMIEREPSSAMLQLQLATVLHKLNHLSPDGGLRIPEAVNAYRAALSSLQEKDAVYINIQGNLAALLLSGNEPEAAIDELQAALQHAEQQGLLLQQFAGLLFNLGKALTTVGKLEEADETYARAAEAAFGHDLGSYSKAVAAPRALQGEVAAQAVWVAQAGRAHFQKQQGLEFLQGMQVKDPGEVRVLHGKALDWITASNSIELVWLHFAIYKHYHRKQQYDLAWQYLDLGNKLMAAHTPHNSAVDENNLHHIKAIFKAPIVTGGLQDDSPIFIVGMPRSGSTLVEQMLASHSEVFAAGEDTALAPLTTDINKALSKPSAAHVKLLRKFGRRYIKRMRDRIPQQGWPDPAGPMRIVDKMLRNLWLIGYIQMLLPKSCIVHVARHPMDVALSCYSQPFGYSASSLSWAWDLDHIAQQLEMAWELVDHWQQQLPGRVHTVLYEDLVSHPEQVARELLSVCGLDWQDSVLHFQATDRPVHTASMVQVRQPLYNSSVGRWKVYKRQLAPLQKRLASLIQRYEQLLQQHLQAHEFMPGKSFEGLPRQQTAGGTGAGEGQQQERESTAGSSSRDEL